jgi:hypothetical protein
MSAVHALKRWEGRLKSDTPTRPRREVGDETDEIERNAGG